MGGVAYWLWSWHRRRAAGLAAVALLASGALGFVTLAGLGARRADTAWDNLRDRARAEDVVLDASSMAAARTLTSEVRDVPGVANAASMSYSYLVPKGRIEDFYGGVILALDSGTLEEVWRPVVTSGRLPDRSRVDEVVVNRSFLETSGLDIGDDVALVDPLGLIEQKVTIVGVSVLPVDFTFAAGAPLAFTTPAFTDEWQDELQELEERAGPDVLASTTLIRGEPGVDADRLAATLVREASPGQVVGVTTAPASATLVVGTLEFQRNAYLALAIGAALASLTLVAFALDRVTRVPSNDVAILRALGFSKRDQRLAVLVPGLLVAVVAAVGATFVVVAWEGLVPTGLARHAGAGRSIGDDWALVALVAVAWALVLGALAVVLAWRSPQRARTIGARRAARVRLARWPALAVGLRAAAGGRTREGRRQTIAALAVVTVAVLGITAVSVVRTSREELYDDPSLSGNFFDIVINTYEDEALARQDRALLLASDSVRALATVEVVNADIDGVGIEGMVVDENMGTMGPPALQGRLPTASDEVAVSPGYRRRLGLDVGDELEIAGPESEQVFRIVGTAVLPFTGTSAAGAQFLVAPAGRDLLGLEAHGFALAVDVRDSQGARAVRAPNDELEACSTAQLLPFLGVEALPGASAQGIGPCVTRIDQRAANLREIGAVPGVLTAFLTFLGVAGLVYFLSAAIQRTARELAVLRAFGFTRRQVIASILVQGATIATLGALFALPFGIAIGRAAWRLTIDDIGLVDRPVVSNIELAAVVISVAVVALLVSAAWGSRLVMRTAARQLRTE